MAWWQSHWWWIWIWWISVFLSSEALPAPTPTPNLWGFHSYFEENLGKCEEHEGSKEYLEIVFEHDEIGGNQLKRQKFNFKFSQLKCFAMLNFFIQDEVECHKLLLFSLLPFLPVAWPNASNWTFLLFSHFKNQGRVFSNQGRLMKNVNRIIEVIWLVMWVINFEAINVPRNRRAWKY